jgi:hypothetical protein
MLDDQKILTQYCNTHDVYVDTPKTIFHVTPFSKMARDYKCFKGASYIHLAIRVHGFLNKLGYDTSGIRMNHIKYIKHIAWHHRYALY